MIGELVFWLMLLAIPVAMIYMATQQPETWRRMCADDQRRKKAAIGGAMKLGAMWLNNRHK